MIETIIKRNGSVEAFSPKKLNGWGEWASKNLGNHVDWSEVVLHVASTSNTEITSSELQDAFINYCLTKRSFAYNRMAGRLYISKLYKDLYKENLPTVKGLFASLVERKLMSKTFFESYSEDEYEKINAMIDHSYDLGYAHYQIEQAMEKYSLQDRVTKEYLETPQYSMIRVAMQACKNRKGDRVKRIEKHYKQYRTDILNIPTPYYTNSGTYRLGLASCCVHHTDDKVGSLAAHNHISYTMTVNSAGQGNKIRTRTVNDPVRGGTIPHQGKKPYYRAEVAMINANLQNGRGGAETQSFDILDPETEEILVLKNPMTPSARQIRGLDYAMCFNKFFASKAAKNEEWALFSYADTPDLYAALALTDDTFEKLYNKYLKEGKARKIVKARDLLRLALKEGVGVGRIYQTNLYEMNLHTPFKESIHLSNLCCVTDDQFVVTSKGIKTVAELYKTGEGLVLFNGNDAVKSSPMRYIKDAEVIKLTLKNGMTHSVTLDHKLLTKNGIAYASDLSVGDDVAIQTKKGLFGATNMEDEAFLLGLYQADGTQHKDSIHICVWEDDFDLLDEIGERFKRVHYKYGCDSYDVINQTGKVVGTRSREPATFKESCVRGGSKRKKSLISKTLKKALDFKKGEVPNWILTSDEATQWQYIRGLFYADGSATYNEKHKSVQVALSSVNKQWLETLQIVLSNLGVNMSLYLHSKAGKTLLPDGKGGSKLYDTKEAHRLVASSLAAAQIFEKEVGIFSRKGFQLPKAKYGVKEFSKIISIESLGVKPTYCVEVFTDDHLWVCNGVITHNCEIALPTSPYQRVDELYYAEKLNDVNLSDEVKGYLSSLNDSVSGEVAVCSLAGINVGKFKSKVGTPEWDAEYRDAAFVALDLIYTAIQDSDYPLPHIAHTAKKRMSAGVGIVDLAHLLAKYKLNYDSQEGRNLIHQVAESHYWHLLNASLEMSKEFGNAEWMDKTKWVEGWLPLDTYNKHVDEVVTVGLQYDWEGLRKRIIDNGGHAFSVLVAHMPAESSSIRSGSTNGVYPIRDLDLNKTNDTNAVKYVVPESDELGKYYQNAYDISVRDMAKVYGILQKWCDQGISADQWFKAQGSDKIKSSELMEGWFSWVYYGVKTRYYINTLTAKGVEMNVELDETADYQPESNADCEECKM